MKGFLIFIGTLVLCAAIAVPVLYFTTDIFTKESGQGHFQGSPTSYPTPGHFQPPTSSGPTQITQREIGQLSNYMLQGRYFQDWPATIQAGETIDISWEADGSLNVWVLTQSQYDYFKVWGITFRYDAFQTGRSGSLVHHVGNTDTYHMIIQNPSLFENIKVYSAVVSVW